MFFKRRSVSLCAALMLAGLARAQKPDEPVTDRNAGDASLQPRVALETTLGTIVVELDAEKAPLTVMNFLDYARNGFYNDTVFHRVVKGRLIHGGGYTRDMNLKNEGLRDPVRYEGGNGLINQRGSFAAYRRFDQRNSAQAQFFINTADNDQLDVLRDNSSYVVFGRVLEGMDVVEKIENVSVSTHPGIAAGFNPYIPVEPVVIQSVRLLTPLDHAKAEDIARKNAWAAENPAEFRTQQFEMECNHSATDIGEGLRSIECRPGTGAFPLPEDTVLINYRGTLVNGTEFDNSQDRSPGPVSVKVKNLIRGLRAGLQLMREGERRIFIVPPELGYGNEGVPGKVPAGATLFFDLELVEVKPAP